ncbi:MAG: hypothetical protein HUJ96_01185 [Marinilabiliaceae bacterium]|nr:hypothetical protein [Marinilabiliaceae bacterium]
MDKPIGGYFEWEFPPMKKFTLHDNAILLNSGRHALEYILRGLGSIRCLYIPYFTCDVVLQPIERLNVHHKFYHINEALELAETIQLEENDYMLYTNYYGIKDEYVSQLSEYFKDHLIIDNAQALFCQVHPESHQIYSPRKFVGMPDGGIAVTPIPDKTETLPTDVSHDRCSHLLKRTELTPSEGYADFKANSKKIAEVTLAKMSIISQNILCSVDLDIIYKRRIENFKKLHKVLGESNKLKIPSLDTFSCPLVYPYWTENKELKKHLLLNNIFVATYWSNVFEWTKPDEFEYQIAEHVICIPIDQRYNGDDIKRIIETIDNF